MSLSIRSAAIGDCGAIWRIMEPVIRAGETFALPRDMTKVDALAHWLASDRTVFVADDEGQVAGTSYLRANRPGPGAHVANAGFMVASGAAGRGVGRALCEHALATAKVRGFRAMQFNHVVASNERAVRLWRQLGFAIIGRAPDAFQHPTLGFTDVLVMFRKL